ncbi:MAG: metallophosphoesterase family protein [Polyangiales bacterium]
MSFASSFARATRAVRPALPNTAGLTIAVTFAVAACALSACANGGGPLPAGEHDAAGTGADALIGNDGSAGGSCAACVTDNDCPTGSACAQFGGDIYCAPTCETSATCGAQASCQTVSGFDGIEDTVCVPTAGPCGEPAAGGSDAGSGGTGEAGSGGTGDAGSGGGTCGTLVGPGTSASCASCGSHTCQANGCYGGWYCDTATSRCQSPPKGGCSSSGDAGSGGTSDTGSGGVVDAGPPPTGSIGASGGSVSRLLFAVVGDTRPAVINDTKGYPTTIITAIFADVAKLNPQFVASTGDYMFATPGKGNVAPQLADYMAARAAYSGLQFPAMGNHECTGATTSNCGAGNTDGVTENLTGFINTMLAPIGQTKPYYAITGITAIDGSWTAKLVFIAGNAWDSGQASWLDSILAQTTTYTFIFRHEPKSANTAPGVTPSEAIIAKHPYTLKIVGHTHTYERKSQQEVLIGNGGAPLTSTSTAFTYGYGLFQQQADGSISVDMVNYQTGATDPSFHFAVKADGSAAP